MRRTAALLGSLALVFTLSTAATVAAPLEASADRTPGSWIVTLADNVDASTNAPRMARQAGGSVGFIYEHALNGFSFAGSDAAAAALARNPGVVRVEADGAVWLVADTVQDPATWGLDRIDQRTGLDGKYSYAYDGTGVSAYVIDTGIDIGHSEFGTRASYGYDAVDDDMTADDCHGHGTHVAGTVGGSTYGVAKDVRLVAVRVLDCNGSGTWSGVIAGIDWVTADAPGKPAVANMSLGGGANSSVDEAVQRSIASGVSYAVAAGNGNMVGIAQDACKYSPARTPEAMTIGATDDTDTKASWSNYGDCVDWFAPGVGITSAWIGSGDTETRKASGTSMASPHTAGAAALYLEFNPGAAPQQVRDALYGATTKDIVKSSKTANNHLLYSRFDLVGGGGETEPTNNPPVAEDVSSAGDEGTNIDWLPLVSDLDGDPVRCSIATQPTAGTATVADDCSSGTYAAPLDVASPVTFEYAVTDGALSDTGIVTITVHQVTESDGTYSVSLTGSSTNQGSTWTAIATVSATGPDGAVNGVTVSGAWDITAGEGAVSCTTGEPLLDGSVVAGKCQVYLSGIRKNTGSVTFTAETVTGGTITWNVPPPITVLKP